MQILEQLNDLRRIELSLLLAVKRQPNLSYYITAYHHIADLNFLTAKHLLMSVFSSVFTLLTDQWSQ